MNSPHFLDTRNGGFFMACDLRVKYDEALKRRAAELFV